MKTGYRIIGETTIPQNEIIAFAEKDIAKEANRAKALCKLAKATSPGTYILKVKEKERVTERGISIITTIDVIEMEEQHEETARKSKQTAANENGTDYQDRGKNGHKATD